MALILPALPTWLLALPTCSEIKALIRLALLTCSEIECNAVPHMVCALEAKTEAYLWEDNKNIDLLSFWFLTKVNAASNSRHVPTVSDTVLLLWIMGKIAATLATSL